MAIKSDPYRPSTRMLIEPWLVEAALGRLAPHSLSPAEQRQIRQVTRKANQVTWPRWWVAR